MSVTESSTFAAKYRRLRLEFVAQLERDVATLRACADSDSERARELVHRIGGSAGTFGFRELSDLAESIECRIRAGDSLSGVFEPLFLKVRECCASVETETS